MNAKDLNPSLPVFDDADQENGNHRLKTPVATRTKALQRKKYEIEGEIKYVKPLQAAAASHKKLSENVQMNTSSHHLQVAPEQLHREPNGSKKKDSRITNPSTQKVYEPTPKRLRIVSNVQNFDRNMESIIEACAKNVSTSDKSNQTLEKHLDGKTIFVSPAKQLAIKPAVTIGTKIPGSNRSGKKLTVSTNNCTDLEEFSSIDGVKSAKSGRTKRGVLSGYADGGTELSTSLPNRPMSTKQGLEKNAGTSGPIKSGFDYESISDKEADTDTTESEDDTCSSYTDTEVDVIFSKSGNTLENRSRISSLSPDNFETSKQKNEASESSLSPEFDQRQNLSKSLPGLVFHLPRKQLSLSDDSLAADRDLSTKKADKHENTEEKVLKSARSRNLLKNSSSSKLESSRISANASTLIEETRLPNKQIPSFLNASPYHQPPGDADRDLDAVQERSPTQRAKMLYTEESMVELTNCRVTPSSISDPCNAVPMPTRHPTTFNLYMAPSSYPVRARQIDSTEDFVVSWLYMQPTVIFPLQTSFRTMIVRMKGTVEFRSNPCVSSRTLLDSVTKLVELEAGRLFHIANTGKEVALIQMTEILR
ncbi:uncharacterized protein LOC116915624 isoform X3 [Daphnia magna]|uniref:uncharacterized protein LOC116915624 isoform X3 n=1 Tax=Daphnia magna TaxID=35525 RepID=UPI001E1BD48C|nr:uncharacterized protein LOC116915624 isoform X3 [Daphnia magna]